MKDVNWVLIVKLFYKKAGRLPNIRKTYNQRNEAWDAGSAAASLESPKARPSWDAWLRLARIALVSEKYIINGSNARTIYEVSTFASEVWVWSCQASSHQARDFFKSKLRQKQTKINKTEWKKAISTQPNLWGWMLLIRKGVTTIHILNWQGVVESFTCDTSICIRLWLLYPPSVPAADASVEKDCRLEASLHSQSPAVISNIVPHTSQRKWGISELDNLCLTAHSSWHAEWFYSRPIFFPEKKREQNASQLARMWVET